MYINLARIPHIFFLASLGAAMLITWRTCPSGVMLSSLSSADPEDPFFMLFGLSFVVKKMAQSKQNCRKPIQRQVLLAFEHTHTNPTCPALLLHSFMLCVGVNSFWHYIFFWDMSSSNSVPLQQDKWPMEAGYGLLKAHRCTLLAPALHIRHVAAQHKKKRPYINSQIKVSPPARRSRYYGI